MVRINTLQAVYTGMVRSILVVVVVIVVVVVVVVICQRIQFLM